MGLCGIHCERHCCFLHAIRVQVLDDSTREEVRAKVDAAAAELAEKGHPVQAGPTVSLFKCTADALRCVRTRNRRELRGGLAMKVVLPCCRSYGGTIEPGSRQGRWWKV